MVQLAAQSLTPAVDALLRRAGQIRVLQVFEHVVNLNAGNEIISLVTPEIGNGPFNVVLPACDFRHHVTMSSTVTVIPNALHIGDLVISFRSAARWNPYPLWSQLRSKQAQLRARIPVIRAVLHQHAPPDSWAQLVVELPAAPKSNLDVQFITFARRRWNNLYKAMINLDQCNCMDYAKQLVGLGNGLTPSGDDWLVGCALAAQLNLPSPETASLLLKTIGLVSSGTTFLSSNWLQATVSGMCNEHWHRFLASCVQPDSDQVCYQAALRIVEQGHSSGADALAGYLATIEQ